MSEDESVRPGATEEQGVEVEGHSVRPGMTDEGETEGDDDFEAHSTRPGTPKGL
jgi:hypothetical protein